MHDETGSARKVLPGVVLGDQARRVLELPVVWSIENGQRLTELELGVERPNGTAAEPAGPTSPGAKATYRNPLTAIFCAETWTVDVGETGPRGNC